jgi:hypothetical protein
MGAKLYQAVELGAGVGLALWVRPLLPPQAATNTPTIRAANTLLAVVACRIFKRAAATAGN